MKYDEQAFILAVNEYEKKLKHIKGDSILVVSELHNKKAFFSFAPLSLAAHNSKKDIHFYVKKGDDVNLEVLEDIWQAYDDLKNNITNEKTEALKDFIEHVDAKTDDDFEAIFRKPNLILYANKKGFKGPIDMEYGCGWFKEHKFRQIKKTCNNLLKNCFNIKKTERLRLGFETIPIKEKLELPLEDYLDSYQIIWAMMDCADKKCKVKMSANTSRFSQLDPAPRFSELLTTIVGCELCKDVDEETFILYKKLSDLLNICRLELFDAAFGIIGKGYYGKHIFGEIIGYPSLDKKTRWESPGAMMYRFDWYPQTFIDKREPMTRYGFTSTLPIDIFIESCDVDYEKLRARNRKIQKIMEVCSSIFVEGETQNGSQTKFEVKMITKNGKRRWARRSDSDVRNKINKEVLKKYKVKAGMMANHPGGEVFVTPEYVKGRFLGDVVISIDQSYRLSKDEPLVIECDEKGYKIIDGPKDIIKKIKTKKEEAWHLLSLQEKNKSIPPDILNIKKGNFENIGEFAINTNPKARLCNYLIVNEKIAKMIHIALGSGFEADKNSSYHMDIVIDSPRQKLDIYGVDKEKKELWIIKKGEFVI